MWKNSNLSIFCVKMKWPKFQLEKILVLFDPMWNKEVWRRRLRHDDIFCVNPYGHVQLYFWENRKFKCFHEWICVWLGFASLAPPFCGTKGFNDRGWVIRTFSVLNRVYINIQSYFRGNRNIQSSHEVWNLTTLNRVAGRVDIILSSWYKWKDLGGLTPPIQVSIK